MSSSCLKPPQNFLRGLRCISGFSGWLGFGRWHHLLRKSSPCENAEQEAQAHREGDSCKRIATYRFVSLLNGLYGLSWLGLYLSAVTTQRRRRRGAPKCDDHYAAQLDCFYKSISAYDLLLPEASVPPGLIISSDVIELTYQASMPKLSRSVCRP